jgi:tetratricopeptide (TPR) repeat protein
MKTKISGFSGTIQLAATVTALVVALLIVVLPFAGTKALEPAIQSAALNADWQVILRRLDPRNHPAADPVDRMLMAHAHLALNHNNEAACAFKALGTPEALTAWAAWAKATATAHPDRAFAQYALGDALARQKDWAGALAAFDNGLRTKDSRVKPLLENARGNVLVASGQADAALVVLDNARSTYPRFADLQASYGTSLLTTAAGAPGALDAFIQAIKLNKDFALAHNGRAAASFALGKWKDAADELVAASNGRPQCLILPQTNADKLARMMTDIEIKEAALVSKQYGMNTNVITSFPNEVRAVEGMSLSHGLNRISTWSGPERTTASPYFEMMGNIDHTVGEVFHSISPLTMGRTEGIATHFLDLADKYNSYRAATTIANPGIRTEPGGISSEDIQRTFVDDGRVELDTRYSLNYQMPSMAAPGH